MRGRKKSTVNNEQSELRKLEEERERLLKLEMKAREMLEEEWCRAIDAQRQRQLEIQRAVTERELRLAYEEREQDLRAELECRGTEVRELRAKLHGMQQGLTNMQQERESVHRRLAMLGNELELAQLNHVERDTLIEKNLREYNEKLQEVERTRSALLDEHFNLKTEHERLKRSHTELEEKYEALKESYKNSPDKQLSAVDPLSTDAETAMLLKVLNEEVEKHREAARLLQSELERRERDEEKSSVLITLLNSQLDSSREDAKRLHDLSNDRRKQLEALQELLDTEREKTKSLHRDLDMAVAESSVERRQLELEIGVHVKQVEELTKALEETQSELTKLKDQHEAFKNKSAEREQSDFQVNVELKSEVEQLKKDLARASDELRLSAEESYKTKALLRAELDSLKVRLQRLQENAEKNERDAFETIAVLRASESRLLEEKKTSEATHEEATRKLRTEVQHVCNERDAFQAQLTKTKQKAEETEKDLYERLLRMTAAHDRLFEELEHMKKSYAAREKDFIESAIFNNAEKETLRAKVEELTDKLEKRKMEHAQHIKGLTTDFENLRGFMNEQISAQKALHQAEVDRATGAEAEVDMLKKEVSQYSVRAEVVAREKEEVERMLRTELRDLRMELSAAKRTIERFECTLGDTSYKSMREANDRLMQEVDQNREKIARLNDTIASMKVESNIMETYKEKVLSEQNEKFALHIQHLEMLRQMVNPLFYELRSVVEKHGLVGHLRRELEAYDEYVRRSRSAVSQSPPPVYRSHNGEQFTIGGNADTAAPVTVNGKPSDVAFMSDTLMKTVPASGEGVSNTGDKAERPRYAPHKPTGVPPGQRQQPPPQQMPDCILPRLC
ncbi:hypothetical protein ERJ75_001354800 [Trypanosoma vivax]|uniref:Uncharacterized protein n=1 Tax=Trypanosoma vivax (strain Y486) TaxID=1055687 RepID=G0UCU9_TRYVY|nr:hypothetical protein TRVL_00875 [Trypanosoma vivax]KAH8608174.1 hypothetical protein ERJ75_001354800 [Trypanosoma vivax]CCC53659.1 conserved hypothetical protein [Trypanosoma vivax Y486]